MHRLYEDIIKELKKKILIKTIICIVLAAVAIAMSALYIAEVTAITDDSGVCQVEVQPHDTPHTNKA